MKTPVMDLERAFVLVNKARVILMSLSPEELSKRYPDWFDWSDFVSTSLAPVSLDSTDLARLERFVEKTEEGVTYPEGFVDLEKYNAHRVKRDREIRMESIGVTRFGSRYGQDLDAWHWIVLPASFTAEDVDNVIDALGWYEYHAPYAGAAFARRPWIKRTRTRVLVRYYTGHDI